MTELLLAAVVIPFLGAAFVLFASDRWARYVCVLSASLSLAAPRRRLPRPPPADRALHLLPPSRARRPSRRSAAWLAAAA